MAWRKSPPALMAAFAAALPNDPRVERRQMFGYPAAFAAGKMATGCWQEFIVAKLPESDRQVLIERHGASVFEPMPGRRMKEYVVMPSAIVGDAKALSNWLAKAVAYAATTASASAIKKKGRAASGKSTARPRTKIKTKTKKRR